MPNTKRTNSTSHSDHLTKGKNGVRLRKTIASAKACKGERTTVALLAREYGMTPAKRTTVRHGGRFTPTHPAGVPPMQEFSRWVVVDAKGNAWDESVARTESHAILRALYGEHTENRKLSPYDRKQWKELRTSNVLTVRTVAVVGDASRAARKGKRAK